MQRLTTIWAPALIAFALVTAPMVSYAQTAPVIPQVRVSHVEMLSVTFTEGAVASGVFTISNAGSGSAGNIDYVIRLVGDYDKNGNWGVEYASQEVGPIALGPNEVRLVPFAIELPAGVAGNDLGIEVQAMLGSGFPLGWAEKRIIITGTHTYPKLTEAYVAIGEGKFAVGEGPTIHSDESAELVGTFQNNAATSLTLTPSIAHKSMTGDVVRTEKAATFTIAPNSSHEFRIPVAASSAKPGVYLANITFLDEGGKQHAQLVSYRYILQGDDIANIQSASADKISVKAKETVTISVSFSGTPPDINRPGAKEQGVALLTVKAYSERGTELGSNTKEVNLDTEHVASVPIVVNASASSLQVSATLTKDGKVLASLEAPVSPKFGIESIRAKTALYFMYSLTALLVIIGLVLLVRSYRSTVPMVKTRQAGITLLALAAVSGIVSVLIIIGLFTPPQQAVSLNLSTPVAHAEGNQKVCVTDPAACGLGGGEAGTQEVIVNPDVCPLDDGVQEIGTPCVHSEMVSFIFVNDNATWEYYVRTYLPIWKKTSTVPYRYWQFEDRYDESVGIGLSPSRVTMEATNNPLQNPFTHAYDSYWEAGMGGASKRYIATDAASSAEQYYETPSDFNNQPPFVSVSSIPGPIRPGDEFTLQGAITYVDCTNTPSGFLVNGRFEGQEFSQEFPANQFTGHELTTVQRRFSKTFTAPTTPGIYRVYLDMGWEVPVLSMGGTLRGHIDIEVKAEVDLTPTDLAPTSAIVNVPTTVSVKVNNTEPDPVGISNTRFEIQGPDFGYETHTVQGESCTITKEGQICEPTTSEESVQIGYYLDQHVVTAAMSGNGFSTASFPLTFTQEGTYKVRACVDYACGWNAYGVYSCDVGSIPETNEANNCTAGDWTDIVVGPAVAAVSCTVNNENPALGESVTYTATPVYGATGPYIWTASDGATGLGTGSTATRSFSTAGTYGMSVSATGALSSGFCPNVTAGNACSNPEATLSASPNRVKQDVPTQVTFSYRATGASSCTLTGPDVNQTYTANECTVSAGTHNATLTITTQGVYTLTCDGDEAKAVVNVIPKFNEF